MKREYSGICIFSKMDSFCDDGYCAYSCGGNIILKCLLKLFFFLFAAALVANGGDSLFGCTEFVLESVLVGSSAC